MIDRPRSGLIAQCRWYWKQDKPIPITLDTAMRAAGYDPDRLYEQVVENNPTD